jgi:hypothetical protein
VGSRSSIPAMTEAELGSLIEREFGFIECLFNGCNPDAEVHLLLCHSDIDSAVLLPPFLC